MNNLIGVGVLRGKNANIKINIKEIIIYTHTFVSLRTFVILSFVNRKICKNPNVISN
jgi:hypothetical protein